MLGPKEDIERLSPGGNALALRFCLDILNISDRSVKKEVPIAVPDPPVVAVVDDAITLFSFFEPTTTSFTLNTDFFTMIN